MAVYQSYQITVVLDKDSDLHKRIQKYADAVGYSFQQALEAVAGAGLYHHMTRNLDFRERMVNAK